MKHMTKMLVFGAVFLGVIIALQYYGIGGQYLVWVAILACLGMHFFMMGHGHEGHGHATEEKREEKQEAEKKQDQKASNAGNGHKSHGGGGCCH